MKDDDVIRAAATLGMNHRDAARLLDRAKESGFESEGELLAEMCRLRGSKATDGQVNRSAYVRQRRTPPAEGSYRPIPTPAARPATWPYPRMVPAWVNEHMRREASPGPMPSTRRVIEPEPVAKPTEPLIVVPDVEWWRCREVWIVIGVVLGVGMMIGRWIL